MALYPRNLRSIQELKQEKLRIKRKADTMFNSFLGTTSNTTTHGTAAHDEGDIIGAGNIMGTVMDFVTSKGFAGKAASLAVPLLSLAGRKIEGNLLKKAAKEVLGGYVKWKGIEIGSRALIMFIKKSAKKKDD